MGAKRFNYLFAKHMTVALKDECSTTSKSLGTGQGVVDVDEEKENVSILPVSVIFICFRIEITFM
jgi:hypothetical protein